MEFKQYDAQEIEPEVLKFWKEQNIHAKAQKKNEKGKKFYFCDGPPYTSGKVHIGTTWNKNMKDMLLRFRRMQGYKVWDRAGYDMHGLPTEHATMKKLGLESKEDILKLGVDKFVEACRELSTTNLKLMNEDFKRLGVWMDFENAYQTISDEWIDAVWWVVQKAYNEKRLYEGLRPMAWDPKAETALAKHELIYKSVEDNSIYVKFKKKDSNEYFVVWTTTPWTIPFNLMIMVHPDLEYAKVKVGNEILIIAKDLWEKVLEVAGEKGELIETVQGSELVGQEYEHFFSDIIDYSMKEEFPKVHTVVPSTEYVTTEYGSGLVHAAPGCGPEDYEVGVKENVPAFNLLDEQGIYPEGTGPFSGKKARFEDEIFTNEINEKGALLTSQPYVHDYPHSERSKSPVIFKTTKQWFFKVSDLKKDMIDGNNEVHWTPKAGYNAFNSWLENLRDNSITKQRFWGTPFPVWKNKDDDQDVIVIGSKAELEELAGTEVKDLHKPAIDKIEIKKDGKTYVKMPDVMDVWLDAGVASWACIGFPKNKELIDEFFPADFIIEGNDQVRGWFNLMMVAGILGFQKASFKNVYMHGMINDSKGRKMSKSEGNYITPDEVVNQFGADAVRLYMIGGTRAGNDLNYNHEDCKNKHKNLFIYWNIHKYLLDLVKTNEIKPGNSNPGLAEKYILSKAYSMIKKVAQEVDLYNLDRIPELVEELLNETSRTYIQLVRDRAGQGSKEDKETIITTLNEVYDISLRLLAPICPFIAEAIYHNLKDVSGHTEESVHLLDFPRVKEELIDEKLEEEMGKAQNMISVVLAARDKAQIGVRWPLSEIKVDQEKLSEEIEEIVKQQTNVKSINYTSLDLGVEIEPDFRAIGKEFGEETADIVTHIKTNSEDIANKIVNNSEYELNGKKITKNHLKITKIAPEGFEYASDGVEILLNTTQNEELLREGYLRELVRRVQALRKEADLEKNDEIHLSLSRELEELVVNKEEFMSKVGATKLDYGNPEEAPHVSKVKVKDKELHLGFWLLDNL